MIAKKKNLDLYAKKLYTAKVSKFSLDSSFWVPNLRLPNWGRLWAKQQGILMISILIEFFFTPYATSVVHRYHGEEKAKMRCDFFDLIFFLLGIILYNIFRTESYCYWHTIELPREINSKRNDFSLESTLKLPLAVARISGRRIRRKLFPWLLLWSGISLTWVLAWGGAEGALDHSEFGGKMYSHYSTLRRVKFLTRRDARRRSFKVKRRDATVVQGEATRRPWRQTLRDRDATKFT